MVRLVSQAGMLVAMALALACASRSASTPPPGPPPAATPQTATAEPDGALVQYDLGLAAMRSGDFTAAAQAFERTIAADPSFAYAYYYAGLAYDRLQRADLMVSRFETFVRLAPEAPERPEVESILRTVRGR